MARQILFRGRKGNVWYFGDLQHDQHGNMFIAFHDDFNHAYRVMLVRPETVGQFTGLVDKNGKQIFEGDVVEDELDGLHDVVVYRNNQFVLESLGDDCINWLECNVIGNVYDHPELVDLEA